MNGLLRPRCPWGDGPQRPVTVWAPGGQLIIRRVRLDHRLAGISLSLQVPHAGKAGSSQGQRKPRFGLPTLVAVSLLPLLPAPLCWDPAAPLLFPWTSISPSSLRQTRQFLRTFSGQALG